MSSNPQELKAIPGPSSPPMPVTPKHSPQPKVATAHTPSIDSGYGTGTSTTPDLRETPSQSCHVTGRPIPGTGKYGNLKQFDQPVSQEIIDRYTAISMQLQPALVEYMNKHFRAHTPIVMRLMVYGRAADEAKPGIVVFCHEKREKRVRRFFGKPFAQDLCEPKEELLHTFQVVILPLPPNMLGSDDLLVWTDSACINKTLSGAPILISSDAALRGTLGGLISITSKEGNLRILGLTAAHVTKYVAVTESDLDSGDDGSVLDSSSDEDGFHAADHTFSGDGGSVSSDKEGVLAGDQRVIPGPDAALDRGDTLSTSVQGSGGATTDDVWYLRNAEPQTEPDDVEPQVSDSDMEFMLGFTWLPGRPGDGQSDPVADCATLDWALVTIDKNSLKPNRLRCAAALRVPDTDLMAATTEKSSSSTNRYVKLNVARDENQGGRLTGLPSSIWLERTGGFVPALPLEMLGTSKLQRGDSGAWVVENTLQVYGHLAAADALGDGYVIPIQDTLESIRQATHSEAVRLTSTMDIASKQISLTSFDRPRSIIRTEAPVRDYGSKAPSGFLDSGYGSREPSSESAFDIVDAFEQTRLRWDEANLFLADSEPSGRMKITEPKSPYGPDVEDQEEEDFALDPRYITVDETDIPTMRKPKSVGFSDPLGLGHDHEAHDDELHETTHQLGQMFIQDRPETLNVSMLTDLGAFRARRLAKALVKEEQEYLNRARDLSEQKKRDLSPEPVHDLSPDYARPKFNDSGYSSRRASPRDP